ncbi:AAA family ATPase [Corynebacterium oculi]|uniref:DNA replication and repair protein RecF n=1 Tax=Corynebacterium oculi TaxID=1544416 RepID=A0A0Q1DUH1_9CORY|nr:AAA family ATPase [Corynebacterium oculi]KQB83773.1 DNA replication and repair protein RecF [Corynebacterium oculi]
MGFLRAMRIDVPPERLPEGYLARVAAVRHLTRQELRFPTPVTVLSGENGAGKSTLIEAIALGMRFQHQGGTRNLYTDKRNDVSRLHEVLILTRERNPRHGYFLRGETHFNVALAYGAEEPPGDIHLNHMSHGESLMQVILHRFHPGGFYLLDEPEAGLSALRQVELLGRIAHLAARGAQFIIATHSPILMAAPGATILELNNAGITPIDFDHAGAVSATREFLDDPEGTAHYLVETDHA